MSKIPTELKTMSFQVIKDMHYENTLKGKNKNRITAFRLLVGIIVGKELLVTHVGCESRILHQLEIGKIMS